MKCCDQALSGGIGTHLLEARWWTRTFRVSHVVVNFEAGGHQVGSALKAIRRSLAKSRFNRFGSKSRRRESHLRGLVSSFLFT